MITSHFLPSNPLGALEYTSTVTTTETMDSTLSYWANQADFDVHQPPECTIGQALHFMSGQFADQDIRVELQELQKAEVGRKYARVDRRPLDPPPVVLLRLFRVYDIDTDRQREEEIIDYGDIQNIGIICTVDLFPVPEYILNNPVVQPTAFELQHLDEPQNLQPYMEHFTFFPMYPFSTQTPTDVSWSLLPTPPRQSLLCRVPPEPPQDIVCRLGNHFVTESSKLTRALVGEKFVEPVLVEYMGKKVLVFVFSDLAVQREGSFILRYRVFDIYSFVLPGTYCPVQTELYGGPFKVYSTRDFPGLSASTELTKSLSKYGVRLATRDMERIYQKRNKTA
ncbi:hypothetical protein D9615_004527 [Tricholomella constricta]|uniref:Velvet domain-containing protein n=1 Tax=Tricholomella constricta TaxID=117010 RepID=A0A8H5HBZ7_9AGAR|nr:hypothetical protein D9615_004527 [Tricholomella constricta]